MSPQKKPEKPVPAGPAKAHRRLRAANGKSSAKRNKKANSNAGRLSRTQEIPLAKIDPQAIVTVQRLVRFGFKTYLVGGCVRDLLLEKVPKDFDIVTEARPEDVRSIFRNSRIIGRRFRLVHLFFREGKIIEIATFRAQIEPKGEGEDLLIKRDNAYGNEQEDALRRDFTVNGLFYDPIAGKIIDYVGGKADIEARRLRMIGLPDVRLQEDPIRIIRAIRFMAKTGLTPDTSLYEQMIALKADIHKCAPPRVIEETFKLIRSGFSKVSLKLLKDAGLLEVLLPAIAAAVQESSELYETLLAYSEALDQQVRKEQVSDAVVLAALASPMVERARANADQKISHQNRAVSECLTAAIENLPITRRLSERLLQIWIAQRHFEPREKTRRRRMKPETLASRAFFADALSLYEIRLAATKKTDPSLTKWRRLL